MIPKGSARAIPVDDFLAAIGEQLDRAQDALAIKARTGRPLTWALKEFKIALQVFVEIDAQGQVLWRSAGPNETGASTVNLDFTTITRPMIEENTYSALDEADGRSIDQIGGADLSDDERVRLRRLGVRNVGQLKRLAPRERLDTVVGVLWAGGMALGLLLIKLTPGYHTELMSYLFGSLVFVGWRDVTLLAILAAVVVATTLVFQRRFR